MRGRMNFELFRLKRRYAGWSLLMNKDRKSPSIREKKSKLPKKVKENVERALSGYNATKGRNIIAKGAKSLNLEVVTFFYRFMDTLLYQISLTWQRT